MVIKKKFFLASASCFDLQTGGILKKKNCVQTSPC